MADEKEAKPTPVGEVRLKNVRGSYLHLWKATASVEGGTVKFRGNFLMDPKTPDGEANIAKCKKAIKAVKLAEWKAKADQIKFKEDRCAFVLGNKCTNADGDVYEGYEDMVVVKAANAKRPTIVDRDRSPLTEEDGKPYSGCFNNVVVRFYAISDPKKGGNGLFASLEAVQYFRKGEAFGAAPMDADKAFDDEGEEDDDEDDTSSKGRGKSKAGALDDDDEEGDDLLG